MPVFVIEKIRAKEKYSRQKGTVSKKGNFEHKKGTVSIKRELSAEKGNCQQKKGTVSRKRELSAKKIVIEKGSGKREVQQ